MFHINRNTHCHPADGAIVVIFYSTVEFAREILVTIALRIEEDGHSRAVVGCGDIAILDKRATVIDTHGGGTYRTANATSIDGRRLIHHHCDTAGDFQQRSVTSKRRGSGDGTIDELCTGVNNQRLRAAKITPKRLFGKVNSRKLIHGNDSALHLLRTALSHSLLTGQRIDVCLQRVELLCADIGDGEHT